MSAAEIPAYEIQGRQVAFPVEVRDASGAIAGFLVLEPRLPIAWSGDAFEIVEFLPGRTLFMLGCIDYKDNDLGDYNEVAMNFFVRKKGASARHPVDRRLARHGEGRPPLLQLEDAGESVIHPRRGRH